MATQMHKILAFDLASNTGWVIWQSREPNPGTSGTITDYIGASIEGFWHKSPL